MVKMRYHINSQSRTLQILSVILTFFSVFFFIAFYANAADVTAPAKDKTFTLTVTNIGSVDMEGVNISARSTNNLITVKEIEPSGTTLTKEGGSQDFKIKFDVACPPEGSDKTETAKFRFTIGSATQGPFYQAGCGVGAICQEVEADFSVEEKLDDHDIF